MGSDYCSACGQAIDDLNAHSCAQPGTVEAVKQLLAVPSPGVESPAGAFALNGIASEERQYRGLGGWLVIVGLGLIFSAIVCAIEAYQTASLFSDGSARLVGDPTGNVYVEGYPALLRFEIAGNLLVSLGAIFLLFLYFWRSSWFPRGYIVSTCSILVFGVMDYVLVGNLIEHAAPDIRGVLQESLEQLTLQLFQIVPGSLLWCAYMLKSKRVRATFTE